MKSPAGDDNGYALQGTNTLRDSARATLESKNPSFLPERMG